MRIKEQVGEKKDTLVLIGMPTVTVFHEKRMTNVREKTLSDSTKKFSSF
jgi:hypothetical protein